MYYQYPPYKDRNGNLIEKGDTIRNITEPDGKEYLVYSNFYEDDLGLNASNEKHPNFCSELRKIYSLIQFDLENEWEIVKKANVEVK